MIITSSNAVSLEADVSELQTVLADLTGLTIDILLVERPAEALAALCASAEGTVSIAWLDGLAALAAEAQACGDMSLVLERTVNEVLQSTHTIQIITRRQIEEIAALADSSLCRIGATDFETWLYPSILLKANGVDVVQDIEDISQFETVSEVAAAVADGDCDGAGIFVASFSALDEATQDDLNVLTPSLDVAYGILLYPQQVSLNLRAAIDNAMTTLAEDEEQRSRLQSVILVDSIRAVNEDDTDSLRDAILAANLDLAQIGR